MQPEPVARRLAARALPPLAILAVLAVLAGPALGPAAAQGDAPTVPTPPTPIVLVTDPKDDQNVTTGPLVTSPPPFANVDLLSVSASQPGPGAVELRVAASGPPTATQQLVLAFRVLRGPHSLANSTASNRSYEIAYHDGVASGVPGAGATVSGNDVVLTVPLEAIGAVGGDLLANVTASVADSSPGSAPAPVTQDDSFATDVAPDAGDSAAYAFQRPAVAGRLLLRVLGGTVRGAGGCHEEDGEGGLADCAVGGPVPFTGAEAPVHDRDATVTFELELKNLGLDPDTVALGVPAVAAARLSLSPATVALGPAESGRAALTVALAGAPNGTLRLAVTAASALGGQAQAEAAVVVDVPAAAQERTPVPEALGFLTPVVTAVGLDGPLGAYAELAFLLFLLLVAVVATYLLLFVVRTPWVRVRVTPRRAVVAPGGVAEFHVEMEGGKRSPALARATLRTEGPWTSGLQVGRAAAPPGQAMDIPLDSGKEAPPKEAVLRVQVPFDAPARERQDLEFDVVPVDAEGAAHPKHAARAKVSVEAAEPAVGKYASARDIRLAEVRHDPPDPRPGATVRTTALIHNDGPVVARLRVVLQKDGKAVAEERVDVPPHDGKGVVLPWTAGAGRNLVKVQIFLA